MVSLCPSSLAVHRLFNLRHITAARDDGLGHVHSLGRVVRLGSIGSNRPGKNTLRADSTEQSIGTTAILDDHRVVGVDVLPKVTSALPGARIDDGAVHLVNHNSVILALVVKQNDVRDLLDQPTVVVRVTHLHAGTREKIRKHSPKSMPTTQPTNKITQPNNQCHNTAR